MTAGRRIDTAWMGSIGKRRSAFMMVIRSTGMHGSPENTPSITNQSNCNCGTVALLIQSVIMSKSQKRIERLQSRPRDYHWDELIALLMSFDYSWVQAGSSHGYFLNANTRHKIGMARPHNQILKTYQISEVLNSLRDEGHIRGE